MEYEIKRFEVMSVLKIGIIMGVLPALFYGLIFVSVNEIAAGAVFVVFFLFGWPIAAIVYNFAANKFGGIKTEIERYETGYKIKRFDVMSMLKIGIILGIPFSIFFYSILMPLLYSKNTGDFGLVGIIIAGVFAGVINGIVLAITSFVYNLGAEKEGIKIETKEHEIKRFKAMSVFKTVSSIVVVILVLATIVIGLIVGVRLGLDGMIFIIIAGIIGAAIYGAVMGILCAIGAILYNFAVGKIGGIKVEIK
ncbi:MAG: hypothetical protein CVT89_06510 [Candidatus Altiarchaeales archaeon HGW-Altiarchaeales-2]|nr:MAG: hypothetical protein CVT89_06510 [Candidatus Altiarchaeales archaeon HGW-Altiarchaeales-2]